MVVSRSKRVLNCNKSRKTEKDWDIKKAERTGIISRKTKIPDEVDLREGWWKIANQGNTGSCVGWATADSVIRWYFVKEGLLSKYQRLSVRFIWMSSKETDEFTFEPTTFIEYEGTSLKAALDIARKLGNVTEKVLPFDGRKLYRGESEEFYELAEELKIKSYHNLKKRTTSWKRWLAEKGPILIRLNVDRRFDRLKKPGRLKKYGGSLEDGAHAAAIVGYNNEGFIIRNSYGTSWGDRGYAYASTEYVRRAVKEAYGVTI